MYVFLPLVWKIPNDHNFKRSDVWITKDFACMLNPASWTLCTVFYKCK